MCTNNPFSNCPKFTCEWYVPDKKKEITKEVNEYEIKHTLMTVSALASLAGAPGAFKEGGPSPFGGFPGMPQGMPFHAMGGRGAPRGYP